MVADHLFFKALEQDCILNQRMYGRTTSSDTGFLMITIPKSIVDW